MIGTLVLIYVLGLLLWSIFGPWINTPHIKRDKRNKIRPSKRNDDQFFIL